MCRLSRGCAVSLVNLFVHQRLSMTPGIRPLSEAQERRLLDCLDESHREIHQEYSKRYHQSIHRIHYPR